VVSRASQEFLQHPLPPAHQCQSRHSLRRGRQRCLSFTNHNGYKRL